MAQATKQELAFLNALATFKKSANDLLAAWHEADHTGDYFNADYPFNKSFDEVISDISKWEETQNNVGFSGELKPQTQAGTTDGQLLQNAINYLNENNVDYLGKTDEKIIALYREMESKFINSILEEEKKDFPKNIDVTIEASNNPHGNFEMNVIAENEILARYWYDTREEAQKDADKLEEFCNVTFI